MPEAMNISQDSVSPAWSGFGRNWPVFSARYSRMAFESKTGFSSSANAGGLGIRVDRHVVRAELVALAGIDRDRFVGQAALLEEKGDLHRVRRGVVVEL